MKPYGNPQALHEALIKTITPSLRYAGGDVSAWQNKARAELKRLLGLPVKNTEDLIETEFTEDRGDYIETRFTFESETGYRPVVNAFLPKTASPKVVICLQGHSKGMHLSLGRPKYPGDDFKISEGRDYAVQAVSRGYAAFALEQRAFGENGGTENGSDCPLPSFTALLMGRTLLGERVFDLTRLIDVIKAHFSDRVDASRICVTGNSGGGTVTIYASALDSRITVAAPSCSLSSYFASIVVRKHCPCNYVPGILNHFDMGDIAALTAPRAMIVVNGVTDPLFPAKEAEEQVEIAGRVYRELGAEGNIVHLLGSAAHRYYPDVIWPEIDKAMNRT